MKNVSDATNVHPPPTTMTLGVILTDCGKEDVNRGTTEQYDAEQQRREIQRDGIVVRFCLLSQMEASRNNNEEESVESRDL